MGLPRNIKMFLLVSAIALGATVLSACNRVDNAQNSAPKILDVGDGVTLAKDSYACTTPLDGLEAIATPNLALPSSSEKEIASNPNCHPVNKFLVNGEWIILKIEGNKLLIKMDEYVGEYWVSKATVLSTSSPRRVSASKVDLASPLRTNFDSKIVKLEPNFPGDNPWEVLNAIRSLNTVQDKYESKVKYIDRLKKLENSNLFDNVKLNGVFVFKVKDPIGIGYNPDLEEITYKTYGDINLDKRDTDSNRWKKFYLEEHHKVVTEEEQIIIVNSHNNKDGYYSYRGKAKISPSMAKAMDGKIALYVVGRFVKPFFIESMKLPLEDDERVVQFQKKLTLSIDEIWMVNESTGEILTKKFSMKREA